ncbi:vWA domain-containing protein [Marivirga tractuosa]|uniref:VWA domain-containing protein n=1 Tax=Marivirga tractuosa TaxID=1006 RepID=UPI0035CEB065
MVTKHQVHNLIILDESGSMGSIKDTIIDGFNEIVQTVKGIAKEYQDQEHFISLVTFNGLGIKKLHFNEPVEKLELIDKDKYKPNASTPLYDAIGFSFNKLRQIVDKHMECNVLVTILTDGLENASREHTGQEVKKMIDELKQNNWTFTYIGADHDVESFATSISINNTMTFKKSAPAMAKMFAKEKLMRGKYSQKIRSKEDLSGNLYEDDKE